MGDGLTIPLTQSQRFASRSSLGIFHGYPSGVTLVTQPMGMWLMSPTHSGVGSSASNKVPTRVK
jgi:hypothetical protein